MTESELAPEKRLGQTLLAKTVVEMVHGEKALQTVLGSTSAFFSAEMEVVLAMSEAEFAQHFQHTAVVEVSTAGDAAGDEAKIITYSSLIVQGGLRKTRGDAKRVIQQRGLQINGRTIEADG